MITITLKELFEAEGALSRILAKPIDFKLAYRMTKITRKIMQESKDIESIRNELVKKYGEEDPKTHNWRVKDDKIAEYRKEFEEFLKEEVELDIQLIPYKVMEAVGQLSALDMVAVEKLVEPEQEVTSDKHRIEPNSKNT